MNQRFTDRARKVMRLAHQEAQRFGHDYIGTEHILLGLVIEGAGVAASVLKNLNIDLTALRLEVERFVQPSLDLVSGSKMQQTPRAKKVIEHAIQEAHSFYHNYVGTEHLLLGLLREEGVAAQVLKNLGLQPQDVRREVLHLIGLGSGPASEPSDARLHGLPAKEFPGEISQGLKELETQIELLNQAKEAAVSRGDFETAARLRDQAHTIAQTRRHSLLQWLERHRPNPAWLTWNSGTVASMVRVIDKERRWQDLPILADALEEAGCTDREMLDHCRLPGEHLFGCWVVALLLDSL